MKRDKYVTGLLQYISQTPALLSVLYDANLLPEQHKPGSQDYFRCLLIAEAWRNQCEKPLAPKGNRD